LSTNTPTYRTTHRTANIATVQTTNDAANQTTFNTTVQCTNRAADNCANQYSDFPANFESLCATNKFSSYLDAFEERGYVLSDFPSYHGSDA
jgi:hypothetical protein